MQNELFKTLLKESEVIEEYKNDYLIQHPENEDFYIRFTYTRGTFIFDAKASEPMLSNSQKSMAYDIVDEFHYNLIETREIERREAEENKRDWQDTYDTLNMLHGTV